MMTIEEDLKIIKDHAHFWNWLPDWDIAIEIYEKVPISFSVLTPFVYSYLEELIRSMTTDYGKIELNEAGKPTRHIVGTSLLNKAKVENMYNFELVGELNKIDKYFDKSMPDDNGSNRNSVVHGYTHPRFWDEQSFQSLIHDIATLSRFARF